VAAGGVAVMLRDAIPEKTGGEAVAGVACIYETSKRAHDFGDLSVSVEASEAVLVALERIKDSVMFELARQVEPAGVAVSA